MKFRINYHNSKDGVEDSFVIEADTIEEIRGLAISETAKRDWDSEDCWSEEIK